MELVKENLSAITYSRNIQFLEHILNNEQLKTLHNRILYLIIHDDWEEGALSVIKHKKFDITSFIFSDYYDTCKDLTKYIDMLAYADVQNQT